MVEPLSSSVIVTVAQLLVHKATMVENVIGHQGLLQTDTLSTHTPWWQQPEFLSRLEYFPMAERDVLVDTGQAIHMSLRD